MGYYDQDYKEPPRRQKGNRSEGFIAGIIGAVIGALIIVFSLPFLSQWDILPYDISGIGENQEEQDEAGVQQPGETKTINVDVETAVTQAVDKASDAVVGVVNIQETTFWQQQGATEAGTGSGVIYKKTDGSAFVVTNHHVVEGASKLEVSLSDGSRVPAELLGSDMFTDLAVLRIDAKHVKKVAEFGTSENLQAGERVLAIGNPLGLQFAGSVTSGIVSGTERSIDIDINKDGQIDWQAEVLQTDAAINPGNSGGALVNLDGQVVGINSMKIAQQSVEGIGFAIPMSTVQPIIEDLEKFGEVKRPFMGISMRSLSEIPSYHWQESLKLPKDVNHGVFVVGVVPGSPAGKAGLQELDVITQLDGQEVKNVIQLRKYLYNNKEIGDTMTITYYRNGQKNSAEIKLASEGTY
ncbi:S1C family serine protease [Bacillus tianshenii]|nr:S1C family serine protease [Bacillus tianshenii]